MNKVELVKMIKEETGLTGEQVNDFFKKYEILVKTALSEEDTKVPMPGFGNFQMKQKAARSEREGVNPKTQEKIVIPAQAAYKTIELKIPKSVKEDMKVVVE